MRPLAAVSASAGIATSAVKSAVGAISDSTRSPTLTRIRGGLVEVAQRRLAPQPHHDRPAGVVDANDRALAHPAPRLRRSRVVFGLVPALVEAVLHAIRRLQVELLDRDGRTCVSCRPVPASARDRQLRVTTLAGQRSRRDVHEIEKEPGPHDHRRERTFVEADDEADRRIAAEVAAADHHQRVRWRAGAPSQCSAGGAVHSRRVPAMPAVSGVSAQPCSRNHPGSLRTCQSISSGRAPPT